MTTEVARPASLGRYRIVDVIGAGAMGVVYKAHDPHIDRTVALKTIRRELLSMQAAGEVVARFQREAKAAGRLSHPGIVAVYDFGEEESTSYIVMEYATGTALSNLAGDGRRLGAHDASAILRQLLDALEYAHAQGVVHRDIKPSNLLLSPEGRLKVTDFGIARIDTGRLTRTGTPVGTPAYMAPEMYLGESGDQRADIYSAGVVLYELLTGALPFEGATIGALAYKVCHTAHAPPSRRVAGLPAGFDRVIDLALAKRADARYANARAFADDVHQAATAGDSSGIGDERRAAALAATLPRGSATSISAQDVEGITSDLTTHVGPIARVLVKRALASSSDVHDLRRNLAEHIADESERRRWLERFAKG